MQLTKAEEQIMQILWTLEKGSVQDILKRFTDSTPARTTVSTLLTILESKNFVEHYNEGRTNIYKALVSKDEYSKKQILGFVKDYFDGSFPSLVSFFAKETNITVDEMDKLLEEMQKSLSDEINKKS